MSNKDKPTQKEVKARLHYDPHTGIFTWLKVSGGNKYVGRVAGSLNNKDGYRYIRFNGTLIAEHNLAWLYVHGEFPAIILDHRNHIRDDNRLKNLGLAGASGNAKNLSLSKKNKSGYHGVYPYLKKGKWLAVIGAGGKLVKLGVFDTKEEAISARLAAELKYGYHLNHGKAT